MRHSLIRRSSWLAATLGLLVVVLGCGLLKRGEARPMLAELAARALELAQQRRAQLSGGGSVASADAPAGYVAMKAKAQLDQSHGNALLLVDDAEKVVVPIYVGNTEALSIRLRLAGERYKRPLTHDLFDAMLGKLGARFVRAQVDALRNNVYHGTVVVRDRDQRVFEIDSRPSDAIALAIGNRAPIFMHQDVVDKAGLRIDDLGKVQKEVGAGTVGKEATPL
jgi:bifunctional DNase/RNase